MLVVAGLLVGLVECNGGQLPDVKKPHPLVRDGVLSYLNDLRARRLAEYSGHLLDLPQGLCGGQHRVDIRQRVVGSSHTDPDNLNKRIGRV